MITLIKSNYYLNLKKNKISILNINNNILHTKNNKFTEIVFKEESISTISNENSEIKNKFESTLKLKNSWRSLSKKSENLNNLVQKIQTTMVFVLSDNYKKIGHPFHLVNPSILPVSLSSGFFFFLTNLVLFMWFGFWHSKLFFYFHIFCIVNLFVVMLTWFLEVFKEEQSGAHTIEIQKGFQYAILLFILSELMLFFSFFWAYFHYTLNANSFTGGSYNAKGVVAFYWYRIPLLNTLLLLSSGLSLTIGHILLISNDKTLKLKIWYNILVMLEVLNITNDNVINIGSSKINFNPINDMVSFLNKIIKNFKIKSNFFKKVTTTISNVIEDKYFNTIDNNLSEIVVFRINSDRTLLVLPTIYTLNLKKDRNLVFNTCTFWIMDTVLKGFVFLMYQAYEYTSSMFSITDSIYSSVFYSLTGLHGIHVFVGVTFLFVFVLVTTQTKKYTTSNEKTIKIINWTSYKLNYFSHRIAFEGSAWYWHFVDVVWFFVFVFVYWWGFSA